MNSNQNTKKVIVTAPGALAKNGSLTCNVIDTAGYDSVSIDVVLGTTDVAITALKIQESDAKSSATALTSGADVTGLVWGTSNNIAGSASTLPASTDGTKIFRFEVDTRYRKRYLLPVVTVANGTNGAYVTLVAELSRAETSPVVAADRGCAEIVRA